MHPATAWNPARGPSSLAAQRPPARPALLADGSIAPIGAPANEHCGGVRSVCGVLWAPSAAPCRVDPGGAGGSPDGHSLPIRKVEWD